MKLPVNIKKKQSSMPIYSAVSLVMLCIALFCLFSPFIPPFSTGLSKSMQTGYMILGGIGTMFFAFVTSYTVFNIVSPPIGITVSEEGIYEYTVAGCGAGFIPKEAIVSLKAFGKDKRQYLGINVDSAHIGNLGEGLAAKREITNNMEAGIPAVIIRQKDIYITVNKLLKIIMEAYSNVEPSVKAPLKPIENQVESEKIDVVNLHTFDIPKVHDVIDDDTIKTAITKEKRQINKTEAKFDVINKPYSAPNENVIKTVDELLEKLNISTKSKSKCETEDTE